MPVALVHMFMTNTFDLHIVNKLKNRLDKL